MLTHCVSVASSKLRERCAARKEACGKILPGGEQGKVDDTRDLSFLQHSQTAQCISQSAKICTAAQSTCEVGKTRLTLGEPLILQLPRQLFVHASSKRTENKMLQNHAQARELEKIGGKKSEC